MVASKRVRRQKSRECVQATLPYCPRHCARQVQRVMKTWWPGPAIAAAETAFTIGVCYSEEEAVVWPLPDKYLVRIAQRQAFGSEGEGRMMSWPLLLKFAQAGVTTRYMQRTPLITSRHSVHFLLTKYGNLWVKTFL